MTNLKNRTSISLDLGSPIMVTVSLETYKKMHRVLGPIASDVNNHAERVYDLIDDLRKDPLVSHHQYITASDALTSLSRDLRNTTKHETIYAISKVKK